MPVKIRPFSESDTESVLALVAAATETDGDAPLNEEARLALTDPDADQPALALVAEAADGVPAGYLQWNPEHGTGCLLVAPGARRRGIGSELLAGLAGRVGQVALWAFGDHGPARGFAARHRLAPIRSLSVMARPLTEAGPPDVPEGVEVRPFGPDDAESFLAVNAAAFAGHPEQGSFSAADLRHRMRETWFDPDGFLLAWDAEGLAGFHWTKRHDAETGEVYVIGTAPRAEGRGIGRMLLAAGLDHLRRAGCSSVILYVDSWNTRAMTMYQRAGFTEAHRDVLYGSGEASGDGS